MKGGLLTSLVLSLRDNPDMRDYAQDGLAFTTKQDRNIGAVTIQEARGSTPTLCKFYVNLYTHSAAIGEILDEPFLLKNDVASGFHWFKRVKPINDGRCFEIDLGSSLGPIADYIAGQVSSEFQDAIRDESLLRMWTSGASPGLSEFQRIVYLAALCLETKDWDQYFLLVEELKEHSDGKPFETKARMLAEQMSSVANKRMS